MNTYMTSSGERLKKSVIDARVRKAKQRKLDAMREEFGYVFCEHETDSGICGKNENCGEPLDCSHEKSVDWCQKNGCSELAYDELKNIKIRCRTHHKEHDNLV